VVKAKIKIMKAFNELKERRPDLAIALESMSFEELLNNYATEVEEKEELEKYKEDNEFFETDLEHIINLGIRWLKKHRKDKHHIYIDSTIAKLIYTNTETKFI